MLIIPLGVFRKAEEIRDNVLFHYPKLFHRVFVRYCEEEWSEIPDFKEKITHLQWYLSKYVSLVMFLKGQIFGSSFYFRSFSGRA